MDSGQVMRGPPRQVDIRDRAALAPRRSASWVRGQPHLFALNIKLSAATTPTAIAVRRSERFVDPA